ncbi:MAG: LysM peptidoglycan-binding domain-containing protein, partial [Candidatus Paceibacterota bacterium]
MSIPAVTHAGMFSFINNIFDNLLTKQNVAQAETVESVSLLQAAINPDPNPTKGGDDLTIVEDEALLPDTGPKGTLANISEDQTSDKISLYTVQKGDTISSVAKMFKVSSNTIIWANDISGSLKQGQVLVILPMSGVTYTVRKGDTFSSIAKNLKADVSQILETNNLTEKDKLAIGDILMIPDGELERPTTSNTPASRVRGANDPYWAGYYIRPVIGGRKTQGLHAYNGIDIASPIGTPIMASASGEVILSKNSGWNDGCGNCIVVAHGNNTHTLYG